jgi:hypothetical protein
VSIIPPKGRLWSNLEKLGSLVVVKLDSVDKVYEDPRIIVGRVREVFMRLAANLFARL